MNHTPQDIINENLERRKALAARANAYDPITVSYTHLTLPTILLV